MSKKSASIFLTQLTGLAGMGLCVKCEWADPYTGFVVSVFHKGDPINHTHHDGETLLEAMNKAWKEWNG